MCSSRQVCFFFSSLISLAVAYGQVHDQGPQSPPAQISDPHGSTTAPVEQIHGADETVPQAAPADLHEDPAVKVADKFVKAIVAADTSAARSTLLAPVAKIDQVALSQMIETFERYDKNSPFKPLWNNGPAPIIDARVGSNFAVVRREYGHHPYLLLLKRRGIWRILPPAFYLNRFDLTRTEQAGLARFEEYAREHWMEAYERDGIPPMAVNLPAPRSIKTTRSPVDPDLPRPTTSPALRLDEEPAPIAYRIGEEWVAAPLLGSRAQKAFRLRKAHPAGHMQSALVVRYSKSAPAPSVQVLQEGLRKGLGQSFPDLQVIESAETTLGGQRAASMVFTGTRGSFQIKGRAVMTTAKGVLAELIFMTDEPEYDRESPSFQHVLDSFEFTR